MKFIVAVTTLDESNKRLREVLSEVSELKIPEMSGIEAARYCVAETADLKYAGYTLNEDESELTLEISDEVILKYMGVYVKVVRAVIPFVKPVMTLFESILDDIREIGQMLNERK